MNLTNVLSLSQGAIVTRRVGAKVLLFIQAPGMAKAQIVAAALSQDDCDRLQAFIDNPPVGEWNRFECTIAQASDLTGT